MSDIRLGGVSLDCEDPQQLGAFWSTLLDGAIVYSSPDIVVVRLEHTLLTAMRVEDFRTPTWPVGTVPKQLHLELGVDDLASAERRALALGARRCDVQSNPENFLVMLDPAGHPFCLSTEVGAFLAST